MTGLVPLTELLKSHSWDDILAAHNEGKLTLHGYDSDAPSHFRKQLPGPPNVLEAALFEHPLGNAICVGVDGYENDAGEVRCEPHFYYCVVARRQEVNAVVWGRAPVGLMPSGYAGRPSVKKIINNELGRLRLAGTAKFGSRAEAAQFLHGWFKDNYPDEQAPEVTTIKKGFPPDYQPAAKRVGARAK
jgi:hypothetical protein